AVLRRDSCPMERSREPTCVRYDGCDAKVSCLLLDGSGSWSRTAEGVYSRFSRIPHRTRATLARSAEVRSVPGSRPVSSNRLLRSCPARQHEVALLHAPHFSFRFSYCGHYGGPPAQNISKTRGGRSRCRFAARRNRRNGRQDSGKLLNPAIRPDDSLHSGAHFSVRLRGRRDVAEFRPWLLKP